MKLRLLLRWFRNLLLLLIGSLPLWICPGIYGFYELRDALDRRYVESLMPIYPNAQRIHEASEFGTANSAELFLYYWTQDDSKTVRQFLEQQYRVTFTERDSYALFSLDLILEDFPSYERNYTCIYRCISAILIPQNVESEVNLPAVVTLRRNYLHDMLQDYRNPQPTAQPTGLSGGTLLIFRYNTPEM